jgi:hypothetical protein
MILARQNAAPVQLLSTTHGLADALEKAKFQNRSDKVISAYRIGWAIVRNGRTTFKLGSWMNVPSGIQPEAVQTVLAQGVQLERHAQKMVFFVSEVRYSDGSHWKASRNSLH